MSFTADMAELEAGLPPARAERLATGAKLVDAPGPPPPPPPEDPPGPGPQPEPARPRIAITTEVEPMRDQAVAALAATARVYQRDGLLVEVMAGISPRLRAVTSGHLLARLSAVALWERHTGRDWVPALPPRHVVVAILEAGAWPGLPTVEGVIQAPTLRADGTLLQDPGYDRASSLYHLPSLPALEIPEQPTAAQVRDAVEQLAEVTADFPFAHDAGFSAWLSMLLTMVARATVSGCTPMFIVDANIRGSGKTKLVDAASIIATGREAEKMGQSKDDEEDGKQLLGVAMSALPLILYDNVDRPLGTASLDRAITAGWVRGRILRSNDQVALPWRTVITATGNNVRVRGDLVRRTLRNRLLSTDERPEKRTGFRHPDLLRWVVRQRPRLVTAALTLLRAYFAAGLPDQRLPTWGSFEEWSAVIRSAIVWADLPDPLECNDQDHDDSDDEAAVLGDLIEGWGELARPAGGWLGTGEALRRLALRGAAGGWAYPATRLRDALAALFGAELPSARQLGNTLKKYRDRPVNGHFLRPCRDNQHKGWGVGIVGAQEEIWPPPQSGTTSTAI